MFRISLQTSLACLLLVATAAVGVAQDRTPPGKNKPVSKSFLKAVPQAWTAFDPATAKPGETVTWKLTVELAPGWHTYPTSQLDPKAEDNVTTITFPQGGEIAFVGELKEPTYKSKAEPEAGIGELHYLEDNVLVWERKGVVNTSAKPGRIDVKVPVRIQVCDANRCLPWQELEFVAPIAISTDGSVPPEPKREGPKSLPASPGKEPPKVANPDPPPTVAAVTTDAPRGGAQSSEGLLSFMISGIIWGAISLLTPCVFPMIPITVSFFLKQSEKEHHRPFAMALTYSATIVIVLTIGAVLLLGFFQVASQHWATNLLLGGLFIFFALSLFGMYEITLPSGLANYTSTQQGRGGTIGTIFMALTFSIISFSCVAPFLGGFAALVPSFGNVVEMIKAGDFAKLGQVFGKLFLGALAFSLTFASPFFFLALFPSLLRKMPKSGSWMNTVKVVMGFLEVAAAVKFLRASERYLTGEAEFLTYDLALGIYIALSLACGLYLLGLFRLPHDEPPEHLGVPRLIFAVLFLSLGFYLAPGLLKLDADRKQRPAGVVFAWLDSFLLPDKTDHNFGSLQVGLKEAADKRKLVFVNFTGVT
ncbi:MAG TPA: cytochrome c biogenesis protein CcdA [Gemmataceae bacterium]|nr:cytochrome c biogenesis protein CcdA [Gemmataceae bacterium]